MKKLIDTGPYHSKIIEEEQRRQRQEDERKEREETAGLQHLRLGDYSDRYDILDGECE